MKLIFEILANTWKFLRRDLNTNEGYAENEAWEEKGFIFKPWNYVEE